LPSDKIPDGIFLQAGLAVFAFHRSPPSGTRLKQKHRCAFQSLPQAKQLCEAAPAGLLLGR